MRPYLPPLERPPRLGQRRLELRLRYRQKGGDSKVDPAAVYMATLHAVDRRTAPGIGRAAKDTLVGDHLELMLPRIGRPRLWRTGSSAPRTLDRHLQPQPAGHGLEVLNIAFAPLMPGQQLGRLGRRHPEGDTDLGSGGDTSVVQLAANRYPQPDGLQPIGVSAPALLGGDLRLRWWR